MKRSTVVWSAGVGGGWQRVGVPVAALLLGVMLCGEAWAQEARVGPRVGIGSSSLFGDDAGSMSPRTSVLAGGGVTLLPVPMFGLSADLLYVQRGGEGSVFDQDVEVALQTLEIPLYARFRAAMVPLVKPELHVGGYVGFLLGASGESGGVSVDLDDRFKPIDGGFLLGIGAVVDLKIVQPSIALRFTQSAGTIAEEVTVGPLSSDVDVRNRTFHVVFGADF